MAKIRSRCAPSGYRRKGICQVFRETLYPAEADLTDGDVSGVLQGKGVDLFELCRIAKPTGRGSGLANRAAAGRIDRSGAAGVRWLLQCLLRTGSHWSARRRTCELCLLGDRLGTGCRCDRCNLPRLPGRQKGLDHRRPCLRPPAQLPSGTVACHALRAQLVAGRDTAALIVLPSTLNALWSLEFRVTSTFAAVGNVAMCIQGP